MRLVWAEDECVAGYDFSPAIFVTNSAFSGNHQIQLPLGGVRMVREVALSCRHSAPFQIKRVSFGKIQRSRFASQCFRNSFKGDDVFSAWRLPWIFFDFVDVYLLHCAKSFFPIEVIGLSPFHDDFLMAVRCHGPLAAVWIVTGISCCAAAARIVGDHVVNKILTASIGKLMCLTGLKEKRVARSHFGYSVLIAHIAATGDDEVKLGFRRMRMIGAK